MDLVLEICDDVLFDNLWASTVPLSAFISSSPQLVQSFNASVADNLILPPSKWSQIIASLPHPPLSKFAAQIASSNSNSIPNISAWPRDYLPRQILSLSIITFIGIHVLYFLFAGLSYYFVFNHDMKRHPRYLKDQVKQEIITSMKSFPGMMVLTVPLFQTEVMGYSRLYAGLPKDTYEWAYLILSVPLFLVFTDWAIYWIHRWLHIPIIYKYIHKPHHKWIIPTPFASYAFHPLDGYLQSIPYHLFAFLLPLHRVLYLILFVVVNFWTILIHDSDMVTGHALEKVINGPAHHTLHHLYFTVNYGQYFTWADRLGGSYRQPQSHLDPLLEVKDKKDD